MPRSSDNELEEGSFPLARATAPIALVCSEYGLFDAVYMTIVTLTTVGYHSTMCIIYMGNPAAREKLAALA